MNNNQFTINFLSLDYLVTSQVVSFASLSFDTVRVLREIPDLNYLTDKFTRIPATKLEVEKLDNGRYKAAVHPLFTELVSIEDDDAHEIARFVSKWFPLVLVISDLEFTPKEFLKMFEVRMFWICLDEITTHPDVTFADIAQIIESTVDFRLKITNMIINTAEVDQLTQIKKRDPESMDKVQLYNVDPDVDPAAVYRFFQTALKQREIGEPPSLTVSFTSAPSNAVLRNSWSRVFCVDEEIDFYWHGTYVVVFRN